MKIAIIDDHSLVRSSVAHMLLEVLNPVKEVIEAGRCEELYQKNSNKTYDLILLDYHIPGATPANTFNYLKEKFPSTPILYISSDEDPKIILDALQNGASGYVVKSSDMELFIAVIDLILAGGKYMPENLISKIRLSPLECNTLLDSNKLSHLSRRQKDVFDLILQQLPNKTIADKLNISESTVKSHIQALFSALGAKSRQEVVDQFKDSLS